MSPPSRRAATDAHHEVADMNGHAVSASVGFHFNGESFHPLKPAHGDITPVSGGVAGEQERATDNPPELRAAAAPVGRAAQEIRIKVCTASVLPAQRSDMHRGKANNGELPEGTEVH